MSPFWITAGTVFVAELGDKTLFTVLLLATEGALLWIGLGAALAFVAQSALSVAAGRLLALLPHLVVRLTAAAVFAVFGVIMLAKREAPETHAVRRRTGAALFFEALVLVFLAEWGDATEVGTAALAARFHAPLRVFGGAVAGLWAGTIVALIAGRLLGRRVPASQLRVLSGLVFLALAVITGVSRWL